MDEPGPPVGVSEGHPEIVPLGGFIQGNVLEPGNVDGLGPYPIYLEGEAVMQDLSFVDIFLQHILVAGVKTEFGFLLLKDFPEA